MAHLAKSSCLQGGSLFSTYQIHSYIPVKSIHSPSPRFFIVLSLSSILNLTEPQAPHSQPATGSPEISRNSSSSSNKCLRLFDRLQCLKICRALLSFRIDFAFASSRIHLHDGPNPGAAIFTLSVLKWCGTKPGLTCRCYFLPGISFRLFSKYCLIY